MNFERGKDPIDALGIGLREQINSYMQDALAEYGTMLMKHTIRDELQARISEHFKVKIKFSIETEEDGEDSPSGSFFKLQKLVVRCKGLEDLKFDMPIGFLPPIQKVASHTIAANLVPVKPMAQPTGSIFYLDYKYKKRNIFRRIFNKLFK